MSDNGSEHDELLGAELRKKLEAEHGEVIAVKTRGGVAAFKVLTGGDYDRYTDLFMEPKTRRQAMKHAVLAARVYPDVGTFQSWVDKYPGIVMTCFNPVVEFAGVETEAATKKYGSA